jgi:transposase
MKNNQLDFRGQTLYIGIDVHKKSWQITIILNGMKVKTFSMNPNPKELYNYLTNHYPNANYHSVYEAGFSGFWADRQLQSLGINNMVVNPADVPTKSKERRTKTDKIDSSKLARELSVGNLEGIYIPSSKAEALRALIRLRRQIVTDQTRQKNRIKSLLMFLGYSVPEDVETRHWSQRYIKALRDLDIEHEESKATLNELLNNLNFIRNQLVQILKQIKEFIAKDEQADKTVRLLKTIPGIGSILAVILYSEIIDINRFKRLDELANYVGFSPAVYSSAEKEINLGITKQKNKYLRNYLIESAWTAIRKDPALQMAYGQLCQKMPSNKAIIRISKKLLNRIRSVWINQQEYVIAIVK